MSATLDRRQLLQRAAGTAAGAIPLFIPASALGRAGRLAPSERIILGSIGVGTMGFGDMNAFLTIPEV
jgi:hypothetical protein